jgi:hypothetical protein
MRDAWAPRDSQVPSIVGPLGDVSGPVVLFLSLSWMWHSVSGGWGRPEAFIGSVHSGYSPGQDVKPGCS